MADLLPPCNNLEKLKSRLSLVPRKHKEDAIQEAWVAHLSGNDPAEAVASFANAERYHEKTRPTFTDCGLDEFGRPEKDLPDAA